MKFSRSFLFALLFAGAGVFLFGGCATTPPPEPKQATFWYSKKPFARVALGESDRLVIVVDSSEVGAQMVSAGFGLLDALGASWPGASSSAPLDDVSVQFARGAQQALDRRGMVGWFQTRLREAVRARVKNEVIILQKEPDRPLIPQGFPHDRLVVVAFHPNFVGTEKTGASPQVVLNADVSWMMFQEPSHFEQLSLERNDGRFAENWRTRYNTLCDAYSFFSYESPAYGRSVWLFNDGLLVRDEMKRVVGRAVQQIVDDLFSHPIPAFRVQPTMRQMIVDVY